MPPTPPTINFLPGSVPANAVAAGIDPLTQLKQLDARLFPVTLLDWRVHDALGTFIGTAGNDDLGLSGGTFGTSTPVLSAGDLKAAGATTRYARKLLHLPPNYMPGETVLLRIAAAMVTTVADTSCTLDVDAYLHDDEGGITGSNLYTGSAQDMNDTFANLSLLDFALTTTNLAAGSVIDTRLAIACNDGATGTAVTPTIAGIWLACDTKG